MGSIFGTDGARGRANVELTPELALRVGRGLVMLLREPAASRPSVLVGRDPRWSGPMLEAALTAGITSAGGDVVSLGVVPTPAVAYLCASGPARAGVVISASHNAVGDNGIKVFGADGFKLSRKQEARLEELITEPELQEAGSRLRPTGTQLGRCPEDAGAVSRYVAHLVGLPEADLSGLRVVVDGANGAASHLAPEVYRQLGATVDCVNCAPDGANINAGAGSTHPQVISRAVVERGFDVGIAHDGDADRVIAAAHDGEVVDGDVVLAVLAREMHEQGTLAGGTVATTVMTNLGFHHAMHELGIGVIETPVGDRNVLAAMLEHGLNLGGEQSGHVICLDHATTGDGILTAVCLLSVVQAAGVPLAELATVMHRLPQVLRNVTVEDRSRLEEADGVWAAVEAEERRLGDGGRVLVRASGTEPVVRVMVEAAAESEAHSSAQRIASAVETALG